MDFIGDLRDVGNAIDTGFHDLNPFSGGQPPQPARTTAPQPAQRTQVPTTHAPGPQPQQHGSFIAPLVHAAGDVADTVMSATSPVFNTLSTANKAVQGLNAAIQSGHPDPNVRKTSAAIAGTVDNMTDPYKQAVSTAQQVVRSPVEIAATLRNKAITLPDKTISSGLTGTNGTVKTIPQDVRGTYQANVSHGKAVAGGMAAADALLHVLGDVPAVGATGVAAKDVGRAAVDSGLKEAAGVAGQHLVSGLANVSHDESGFAKVPGKTATQGAQTVSKAQLTKSIISNYKGGSAGPEEAKAFDWIKNNPVEAMHNYDAQVAKEYGAPQSNIVAGDSGKFAIPGMTADKSGVYHEPGSALAKAKLDLLLKDPSTKDKPVLLMAGGAGAGKTSALKSVLANAGKSLDDYAAIIDTNSNKLESAARNIDKAVASGRKVDVQYVYRDPYDAFVNGVMPRAQKIGRIVPTEATAETHFGSRQVVQQLSKKYKGNPDVNVRAIDNSGPVGSAKLVSIANMPKPGYNKGQLLSNINKAVEDAYQQGQITEAEARTYLGHEPGSTAVSNEKAGNVQAVRGSQGERNGGGNERPSAAVGAPESVGSILDRTRGGGTQPPAAKVEAKPVPAGEKERKFITSVKNSPEVSPEVQGKVEGSYKPTSNKTLTAGSQKLIDQGLDKATNEVLSSLKKPTGKISPQEVSNAIEVAKAHDAAGHYEQATNIFDQLATHGTALGQRVQAFALLSRRTPEGVLNMANKALKEGGAKLTPELQGQVNQLYERIKATPEGSNERSYAIQDLQKLVDRNTKQSKLDQAFTLWRTGLLTGPQTATKVLLSHGIMNAAEKIKDIPATILDTALSGATGMRSTALTMRGTGTGAKQGAAAALELLLHGHDQPSTSGFGAFDELGHGRTAYGNSAAGKVLNFYTEKVGQVHAAMPKTFYRSAYMNDLYKQGEAAAKTAKVPPADHAQFIKDFVDNPSEEAAQGAHIAAQYATFQQPTFLGKAAGKFQQMPGGRGLAPFAHIASSILTDVKNYSPIGVMQSIYDAVKGSKNGWTPQLQKQLVEGVGRGVTGTGVIALGGMLFNRGMITTNYPTDKKEQALWKSEGKQENSIKIGGQWRQTGSLGPLGSLLSAGALYAESGTNNAKGKSNAGAALAGALQNISSQSYLSGMTEAAGALQNPVQNLNSFEKLEFGSIVPTGVGTVARATDSKDRTANTPMQTLESKIPGLREHLPASTDMFGTTIPRQGGVVTNLLDPTRPTNIKNDPVTNELQRLVDNTGTSGTPVPAPPTKISGVNPDGSKVSLPLSKDAQNKYQVQAGPAIYQALKSVIDDPRYAAQSDDVKNKALTAAYTNADNIQKSIYLGQQKPGAGIKLTAAQVGIQSGNAPDYITNAQIKAAGGTSVASSLNSGLSPQYKSTLTKVAVMNSTAKAAWMKDPQNKYAYDVATANNDNLNGKYDSVQWFQKQQDLAKEQVTAQFPETVTELYGKSKANITKYLDEQSPSSATQIESQLVAYDNALYNAGMSTTLKFKNGVTSSGSSSGSSSSTSTMAGGYPLIKAPTNDLSAYKALDTALKSTSKIIKPKAVKAQKIVSYKAKPMKLSGKSGGSFKQKSYKVHNPSAPKQPKLPKLTNPRSATLSTSSKSGQRVKLSV